MVNLCVPLVVWGRVLSGGHDLGPTTLTLHGGRIAALEPAAAPPPGADVVVRDGWIGPGLVDLQVNGAGGVDLTSAADADQAVASVGCILARHGVTSFCPTLVSSPAELIISRVRAFRRVGLGAHVEGPFIDPEHRGVHDPRLLRHARADEVRAWIKAGPPAIVTLAPELPGALDAIKQLSGAGVVVSLGHSGADAATAQAAIAVGARMGTHVFNTMPPLHHRQPGLVGALLTSSATLGLIADGVHLDPLVLDVVVRTAGPGRVALVSDALAAAGSPPGPVALGEQMVHSDGRVVRRADGTLAGSAVLLDTCVRNARAWLPWLRPAEVLQMATQTPADLLGLRRKGRVVVGADADLAVLDRDWRVAETILAGQVVSSTASR